MSEHKDLVKIGDYTFDLAWLMSSALVGVPLDKSFLRELEIRVGTEFRSKGQVVDFLSRFFCMGLREEWLLDELGFTDGSDKLRGSTLAFQDMQKAYEQMGQNNYPQVLAELDNFTHSEPSPPQPKKLSRLEEQLRQALVNALEAAVFGRVHTGTVCIAKCEQDDGECCRQVSNLQASPSCYKFALKSLAELDNLALPS
jgi:hypothetical protein